MLWEPPALEGTEPGHGKFRGFTFGGLNERNMALLSRIKTRYKVCATALKTHEKLFLERSRRWPKGTGSLNLGLVHVSYSAQNLSRTILDELAWNAANGLGMGSETSST